MILSPGMSFLQFNPGSATSPVAVSNVSGVLDVVDSLSLDDRGSHANCGVLEGVVQMVSQLHETALAKRVNSRSRHSMPAAESRARSSSTRHDPARLEVIEEPQRLEKPVETSRSRRSFEKPVEISRSRSGFESRSSCSAL
jgi:hypothetical protein